MTSPARMMKNTCAAVVMKFQISSLLQRKDTAILVQKFPSNGNCEAMVARHFLFQPGYIVLDRFVLSVCSCGIKLSRNKLEY